MNFLDLKYEFSFALEKITAFFAKILWTIKNQIIYFRIIKNTRPWDYSYILEMMKFQIEILCKNIEKNSLEIDETRLPKIEKMKRAIELLNNIIEDNFAIRCGYNPDAIKFKTKLTKDGLYELIAEKNPKFENYNEIEVFENASKLEQKEWNELFDILKNNLKEWWY